MFSHRGLFLAVTISLASIALAGVLVQPGYEHEYDSIPRYLQNQSVSQPSLIEQYRAEQLPDQESTRYLPGVQTTEKNEDPKEMIHNRRKRSDPASTESSKSEIIAHDKDVPAKSSLTDPKHPTITTIDSLLLADTNDKRLEKCEAVTYDLLSIPLHSNTENNANVASSTDDAKFPPFFNYSLIPENEFPESKRTDTTDKRLAYCRDMNEFFIVHIQERLTFLHDTSSGHETYSDTPIPADKRLEKCQAVTNDLLSIPLPDLFKYSNTKNSAYVVTKSSSTDAKRPHPFYYSLVPENELPESERTDTTDKRLAFCRGMNEYFIFHIQLHLKSLQDISSGRQTFEYSNAPIRTGIW
ncbi:uncharacterized protein [Temnothorax nylanderi]|uniref:uncharacterized protein n=1 Tax=Temnothorax nylanderi TaxID=102681 RepID=UPI003A88C92D